MALKRVGVFFVGEKEEWDVGVPLRDTFERCRLVERGDENIEGVGEDICIALTELGLRNACRVSPLLGVCGVYLGV